MMRRVTYGGFLALAVASAAVAAAVGSPTYHPVVYGLSLALGVVTHYQADRRLVEEAIGTTIIGVSGGLVASEVVLTTVSVYVIGMPVDYAAWSMWTQLLFPWAYVLTLLLTGYFCAGMLDMLQ